MSDRYACHARLWRGRQESARVGVIYLHGIQSHGGWYEWSASVLAERGVTVLMPDRRGSGLNAAARGDTPSAARWLDDLDAVESQFRAMCGIERLAVIGVSWGGKLACAWAARRGAFDALLLIAPGIVPKVDVSRSTRLAIAWACLVARRRRFPIPLSDPQLFTATPEAQRLIAEDPHKLSTATAWFFLHSTLMDRAMRRLKPGVLGPQAALWLAERDQIIHNGQTAEWMQKLAPGAGVRVFSGASHTLEFERDIREFEYALGDWAASVIGRSDST